MRHPSYSEVTYLWLLIVTCFKENPSADKYK
jgi:hypothetical protein